MVKKTWQLNGASRAYYASIQKQDQAVKEVQFLKRKLKDEQSKVRELEEKNARLQEQIDVAKSSEALSNACFYEKETSFQKELSQALEESKRYASRLRLAYSKIQRLSGCNNIATELDPQKVSEVILRYLEESELTEEEIVEGFLSVMCTEKKFEKHLIEGIIGRDLRRISTHYKSTIYKELKWKFRPWVCLMELDKVATISFRGYEVMRRIEFNGEEAKYRQGLFYNRMELSRVSKELENYGATILPYELTSNAVKFDVRIADRFILEKYGLWHYVENKESVIAAATVDGGELAWKLTQVSAGIKICDPRAIDPTTGNLLFGESGHDNVQSRSLCFPLHVHISKDNSAFYSTHLQSFFPRPK